MELNGKHTLFGRVVGNTLFNMLRLADVDVTNGDRPTRLHRVLKTTVHKYLLIIFHTAIALLISYNIWVLFASGFSTLVRQTVFIVV